MSNYTYKKQEEENSSQVDSAVRKALANDSTVKNTAQQAVQKAAKTGAVSSVNQPTAAVQGTTVQPAATQSQAGYQSKWQQGLDDTMEKILNREKFSYDLNGDALWNQYKDQYTQQGKMAMLDTMGQAAAMTGGYGNSYAQTVGQQTYQGYLQQMNEMIPELYQLALSKYQMEGDELMDQYGLLADQDDREYNRYVDDRNYEYQVGRDQVADSQWQQEFDYQQDRDAVSDQRYDQEWAYQQSRDELEDQRYDQEWAYQQDRDAVSDQRYDQEWEYQKGRDQIEDQRYADEFAYQQSRDQVSDEQWQAEFDEDKRRYDQEYADSKSSGSGSGSSGSSSSGGYADYSDSELRNEMIHAGSRKNAEALAEEMIADGVDEDYAYSLVYQYYEEDKASTAGSYGSVNVRESGDKNKGFNYTV